MGCGYGLLQRPPTDATVQGGTDSRGGSRRTTGRLGNGRMAHHGLHRTKTRLMVVETSRLHSSSERAHVELIERSRNLSVTAFHEKAGRSQGNSGFIVSSWFFR